MDVLTAYARILRRFWWLALLPVIGVAIATALTTREVGGAVTYQVVMRFAAGLPPETAPEAYKYDRYYAWLASEYVANGFGDVVRTGAFAEAVARRAGATAAQVQGGISADHKQSITVVYLNWPDAEGARRVAEAITQELTQNAAAYFPQLAGANVPPMTRLDAPAPVAVAPPLRSRFDLPIRLLLALAAGLALAFLAHVSDPFVRERRQIESMGVRVIGAIPPQSGSI